MDSLLSIKKYLYSFSVPFKLDMVITNIALISIWIVDKITLNGCSLL